MTTQEKIRDYVLGFVGYTALAVMTLWVGINWLSGCGESFPTAAGTYIQGECISLGEMFGVE